MAATTTAATTISRSLSSLFFISSPPYPKPSSVSVLPARLISRGEPTGVKARAIASSSPKPKGEPRGIMKPRRVSPEMQALVGVPEIPRTHALKRIWAHIKENNLQDPNDKKVIICDEKLKKIFGGKDRVGFLEIAGLISPLMFMDIMALLCLVLIALFFYLSPGCGYGLGARNMRR